MYVNILKGMRQEHVINRLSRGKSMAVIPDFSSFKQIFILNFFLKKCVCSSYTSVSSSFSAFSIFNLFVHLSYFNNLMWKPVKCVFHGITFLCLCSSADSSLYGSEGSGLHTQTSSQSETIMQFTHRPDIQWTPHADEPPCFSSQVPPPPQCTEWAGLQAAPSALRGRNAAFLEPETRWR